MTKYNANPLNNFMAALKCIPDTSILLPMFPLESKKGFILTP